MDRHLKERLVGAAVLVAAAIILIPEMLSGPHESSVVATEASATADAGVKTYTIDLNAPSGQTARQDQSTPPTFTEVAPPAESCPGPSSSPDSATPSTEPRPSPNRDEQLLDQHRTLTGSENRVVDTEATKPTEKSPAVDRIPEKQIEKPAEKSSERESGNVASAEKNQSKQSIKPTETQARSGWAVQVASFEARATSDRIASELKAKGFSSFVVAFTAKGKTMYRVRVGPVEDRAAAEALLKKVKQVHPQAALAPP